MENKINLKDIIVSLKKNFFYIILIYIFLYVLAYLIENFTPYNSASESVFSELRVFPIEPIEEANIKNNLTFFFINTLDLDPSRTTKKELFQVSAEEILNDFLIRLSDQELVSIVVRNNPDIDRKLIRTIQDSISIEYQENPRSAFVSINTSNKPNTNKAFYSLISSAVELTDIKVRKLIDLNIKNTRDQLEQRVKYLDQLSNLEYEINGYELLKKTSRINLSNFVTYDFSFISDIKFLTLSLQPKKIIGLKRYTVNLSALSILFSTIFSIILVFIRTDKLKV